MSRLACCHPMPSCCKTLRPKWPECWSWCGRTLIISKQTNT